MSLKDTLGKIIENVDGALSAMVMAYDGIHIDEVSVEQDELDMQLLSVEYATVFRDIKRAVEVIKAGDLEEVTITSSRTVVTLRVLNDDLFAVLIMKHGGNFGKGRYRLRLNSIELLRELS